jgi:hypothetical protein
MSIAVAAMASYESFFLKKSIQADDSASMFLSSKLIAASFNDSLLPTCHNTPNFPSSVIILKLGISVTIGMQPHAKASHNA